MLMISHCPAFAAVAPRVALPRIAWAARGLARARGWAAAVRRWRMRRWLKRNRDRIALVAIVARDAHELSELGRRVRAETFREMEDRHRLALLALDGHELSELGRRMRAETLREMEDRLRDLDQRPSGDAPPGDAERPRRR